VVALLLAAVVLTPVAAGAAPASGTLSFSPATLEFGSVRVGTGSTLKTITVTNTDSTNDVVISGVSVGGTNPNDFVLKTDCVGTIVGTGAQSPKTLTPGQTCTVTVKFVPIGDKGRTAEVSVTNDSAESPKKATVSGTGTMGYYIGGLFGEVQTFGDATDFGDATGLDLNAQMIDMATDQADGEGFWLLGTDGGVFAFDTGFYGSTGGMTLNSPVIGMAAAPVTSTLDGKGYWFVALDGGVFAYGPDAAFMGSMGGQKLNAPVVAMAASPSGGGYWLVASDGGVFAFGDAPFKGSMGGTPLNEPIVGIAATPSGQGYWLVASDGGMFSFGDAPFKGSMGGTPLVADIVDMWPSPTGGGYWLAAADGGIFNFGDAPFLGALGGGDVDDAISVAGTAPPLSPFAQSKRIAL
jgi:hypothetical protein